MGQESSIVGFIVIVVLYAVIGLMSAAGPVFLTQRMFTLKAEQIFYGLFLIPIAGFYLAFTAYFGLATAWRLERTAVLAFAALGLLGTRAPFAIIIGYPLHGLWDLVHELHMHSSFAIFEPGQVGIVEEVARPVDRRERQPEPLQRLRQFRGRPALEDRRNLRD
jgi:hypothetical protein